MVKVKKDIAAEPDFCVYKVSHWTKYFNTDPVPVTMIESGISYYAARLRCHELNKSELGMVWHLGVYKPARTSDVEAVLEKLSQMRLI